VTHKGRREAEAAPALKGWGGEETEKGFEGYVCVSLSNGVFSLDWE